MITVGLSQRWWFYTINFNWLFRKITWQVAGGRRDDGFNVRQCETMCALYVEIGIVICLIFYRNFQMGLLLYSKIINLIMYLYLKTFPLILLFCLIILYRQTSIIVINSSKRTYSIKLIKQSDAQHMYIYYLIKCFCTQVLF